jgi:hypothetical protein
VWAYVEGAGWTAEKWRALGDDEEGAAQRRQALADGFRSYVAELRSSERDPVEAVDFDKVKAAEELFGSSLASELATTRTQALLRAYDRTGELPPDGLDWLRRFEPDKAERIAAERRQRDAELAEQRERARRAADRLREGGGAAAGLRSGVSYEGFAKAADHSAGAGAAIAGDGQVVHDGPVVDPVKAKEFVDGFSPPPLAPGEKKPAWRVDQERRNGEGEMGLGGLGVFSGGGLIALGATGAVSVGMIVTGGVVLVGGAALVYYGYQKYKENSP